MKRSKPLMRLSPEAAGALNQECGRVSAELLAHLRYRRELDRQLGALIGHYSLRKLHKNTKDALLLADLVKEVA
jgi:hypothetical protein